MKIIFYSALICFIHHKISVYDVLQVSAQDFVTEWSAACPRFRHVQHKQVYLTSPDPLMHMYIYICDWYMSHENSMNANVKSTIVKGPQKHQWSLINNMASGYLYISWPFFYFHTRNIQASGFPDLAMQEAGTNGSICLLGISIDRIIWAEREGLSALTQRGKQQESAASLT